MKKVCWLLIFVFLLGCVIGCQQGQGSIENEDGTLSDWKREEIERAYEEQFDGAVGIAHGQDMRYYGNENGYILIYSRGALSSLHRVQIGPKSFKSGYNFTLFAYKDGVLYDLKDVYEDGLVSLEAIENAWKIHQEYEGY